MTTSPSPSSSRPELVFSSDHGGFELKELLKRTAQEWGYRVSDFGVFSPTPADYADYIAPVVREVLKGAIGILVCGSGIGMSMGANRFKGIRAALCVNEHMARLARSHNNANILVLGERLIDKEEAIACLKTFLGTSFEGDRHTRRVEKLDQLIVTEG